MTLGLAVDLAYFLNMTWDLCIILAMFFHTHDMEVMRLPNGQGFSSVLTHDMGIEEESWDLQEKHLQASANLFSATPTPL